VASSSAGSSSWTSFMVPIHHGRSRVITSGSCASQWCSCDRWSGTGLKAYGSFVHPKVHFARAAALGRQGGREYCEAWFDVTGGIQAVRIT
jgi:hypothetical protein